MKPRILAVDDNPNILDLLEIILCKDYDVATAANGFEGLQKLANWPPDLIITDIAMPVMDGIRFVNHLRKQPDWQKIPVLAITSFAAKYPEKSLQALGFHTVVAKPFTKQHVLAAVRKCFKEKAA